MIAQANKILQSFYPDFEIYRSASRRLRIKSRYGDIPANVASHSGSLSCNYGKLGTGGTGALAIGQLIRWIRNQTRLPLISWEYWSSEKIKLCNNKTVELVKNSSYCNDKKTCCVLCGSKNVGDWWIRDGIVGPCCYLGRCYGKRENVERKKFHETV